MATVVQMKRKPTPEPAEQPTKKARTETKVPSSTRGCDTVRHTLLSRLYPHLSILREYVLTKLPPSSRLRRKKIASVGRQDARPEHNRPCSDIEVAVGHLLDTTLVGFYDTPPAKSDNRWEQWATFSQRGDESYVTLADGSAGAFFSQREVRCAVVLLGSRRRH